jgi:type IV secretion system protein VirB4
MLRGASVENRTAPGRALDGCEAQQTLLSSLDRYEPECLRVEERDDRRYSQVLEILSLLINAEWQSVPLPRAPLNEVLATTRVIFGSEAIEYRSATDTRFGAMLGIKEYHAHGGMYDALSAPFALSLCNLPILEQSGR